ncbi:MAG: AAA family ATPase [Anaerolineae bacterium]|nr:AAA family ATPase [Thermoflexales bacterium]MDW8395953.1 AAA family ATPase [Anaerolineae bacterium]
MLTKLTLRNFKLFDEVEIELGSRVIFVGPNNSGKTSALQAIALWDVGVKRWLEKRGNGSVPAERAGVTISRQDLIAIPAPAASLLWRDLHTREAERIEGKQRTRNVRVEIDVEGVNERTWRCAMEFDYANEESIYCRSKLGDDQKRLPVPEHLRTLQVAYLPPMSGLAAREDRLEMGSIRVRLGEGRTAEVLRNLCWQVLQRSGGEQEWSKICDSLQRLFGSRLNRPVYIVERGEITLSYRNRSGVELDITASGRGEQQTLLLLAHMAVNPGAVLLLDEPDAHLEILRQRQIYDVISEQAERTGSQIIAASHSEVLLNEAAQKDIVIAFIGKPHRIDNRGDQVLKALRDVGFEDDYLAEEVGWVLYLEGATDLDILRAFARSLEHPAQTHLERPFVRYVGNQPKRVREHFYALREAKPDLVGIAIFDRLNRDLEQRPELQQLMWSRREIENYLCHREALLAFAEHGSSSVRSSPVQRGLANQDGQGDSVCRGRPENAWQRRLGRRRQGKRGFPHSSVRTVLQRNRTTERDEEDQLPSARAVRP